MAAVFAKDRADEQLARQHLIDPEICIRCNTCEEICPVHAITHDSRNYVVNFDICNACNACNACISPCPTGSIDNWRHVAKSKPYTLEQQFSWESLPAQTELDVTGHAEFPEDVARLTAEATAGQGVATAPPWSAAQPQVNLFTIRSPAIATVTGNIRLTEEGATSDIHHVVLDFGGTVFPVLEGQSIGIIPPGVDANGKPHHVRLYSIASPRDGERPNYNNVSLTVKRVTSDHDGNTVRGMGSNYVCDLQKGDKVKVVGPYGTSFLMPNHPGSSIMMICTGTGSAPMRAMTERRRRHKGEGGGDLMLFFGARHPHELPYFGPLMKLPREFIDVNFAFSRIPDRPKKYVQDAIRERGDKVARLLADDNCFIYICGLKGMEAGVMDAFRDVCRARNLDWDRMRPELLAKNRFHVETY